jgi:hypothetical protein
MHRWHIINHFIRKYDYKSYLEIGYFKGWSFDNVHCEHKIAVDPNPSKNEKQQNLPYGEVYMYDQVNGQGMSVEFTAVHKLTSDEFFGKLRIDRKCDIIFIDGLHEAEQVKRDIDNSLAHLSPGGIIILHDMNPPKYAHTTTGIDGCWTGDCYKAILSYGAARPFTYYTIDTDWGVGVLRPLKRVAEPFTDATMAAMIMDARNLDYERAQQDWPYFDEHRKELMNIISVEEFLKKEEYATA